MNDIFLKLKDKYIELIIAGIFATSVYFVRTIYLTIGENSKHMIEHSKDIEKLKTSDEIKTKTDLEILNQLERLSNKVNDNKIDIEVLKSKHGK